MNRHYEALIERLERIERKLEVFTLQSELRHRDNAAKQGLCHRCGSHFSPTHICLDGGFRGDPPMGSADAQIILTERREKIK